LAYSVFIKALNDLNKLENLQKGIGTSVGSICAFICSIKPTNLEIDEYMALVVEKILNLNDNILKESYNLYKYYGIHDNSGIREVIEDILLKKFGKNKLSFIELFELTKFELTVVATCLSEKKVYYLNYLNNPDMPVSLAIQMSTALPIFYKSISYDNKIWCDGGVCNNFPINYFMADNEIKKNTLGINLSCDDDKQQFHDIKTESDFVSCVISSAMLYQNYFIEQSINKSYDINIITVDTKSISTTDFKISKEEIKLLEEIGYETTKQNLKNGKKWFYFF
jgi:predicted acylesterase/phospholipase RssA